jgi:hypothetical protein
MAFGAFLAVLGWHASVDAHEVNLDLGCGVSLQVKQANHFRQVDDPTDAQKKRVAMPVEFILRYKLKECPPQGATIYQIKKGRALIDGRPTQQPGNAPLREDAFTLDSTKENKQLAEGMRHTDLGFRGHDAPGSTGFPPGRPPAIVLDLTFQTLIRYRDDRNCCGAEHVILLQWGGRFDNTARPPVNEAYPVRVVYVRPNPHRCTCHRSGTRHDGKVDVARLNPDRIEPAAEWATVGIPDPPQFGAEPPAPPPPAGAQPPPAGSPPPSTPPRPPPYTGPCAEIVNRFLAQGYRLQSTGDPIVLVSDTVRVVIPHGTCRPAATPR